MEFVAPGGVRVVTVETPKGTYPGTDFGNAFFTVSVNGYLTRGECEQFPDDVSGSQKPITKNFNGMEFHGLEQGEGGMNHQFGGIYYHGFSEGSCYELGEGIATAGYGAVDGMKKVDDRQVFAILEKILRSVTIHAPKASVTDAASPSIQSFVLSRMLKRSPTSTYRVAWDVKGGEASQVWLSASCFGDPTFFGVTQNTPEGTVFPCDKLNPAGSASRSLDLEFRNMTGEEIKETIRLFAGGNPSVSRSVTINLPPLPVVITVVSNAKHVFPFDNTPVQIVAGQNIQIGGVAFLPQQILWIGSTSLPVESADSLSITFKAPESLSTGEYPLFVVNERGRSNVVMVQVLK